MTQAYQAQTEQNTSTSEFNRMAHIIQSLTSRNATATLVRVMRVENTGGVEPVGLIDVNPLVAQIDGAGNPVAHGVIHDVPYMRVQGGANAVIIDPQVGDIGICVFASHDISSVKANKAPSNPGSRRRFSMADALYVGGVLNAAPQQYLRFSAGGIEIKSALVTITGDVRIIGDVTVDKTVTATTDVVGGGKSLKTHTHSGVMPGGGVSGPPV